MIIRKLHPFGSLIYRTQPFDQVAEAQGIKGAVNLGYAAAIMAETYLSLSHCTNKNYRETRKVLYSLFMPWVYYVPRMPWKGMNELSLLEVIYK